MASVGALPSVFTRAGRRTRFVLGYAFPTALVDRLVELDPELTRDEAQDAVEALRLWFVERILVDWTPAPAGLADTAWREFILMTKLYREFCDDAFASYCHYPP